MQSMDIHTARTILQLRPNSDSSEIKKQYHKLALKFHPDKNKRPDAHQKFLEVNEAYKFLVENESSNKSYVREYDEILLDLIKLTYQNGKFNDDLFRFVKSIMDNYSKLSQSSLNDIPPDIIIKCYKFINQNRELLGIPQSVIDILNSIVKNGENTENVHIVTPSLLDMYESNILKLDYNGNIYLIPLWHSELAFDIDGKDEELEITCVPDLPEHMSLDNDNNLHVYVRTGIQSLLDKESFVVDLQIKTIEINVSNLKITRHQTVTHKRSGIPRIDEGDMYNNENRGDIMIHVELY